MKKGLCHSYSSFVVGNTRLLLLGGDVDVVGGDQVVGVLHEASELGRRPPCFVMCFPDHIV